MKKTVLLKLTVVISAAVTVILRFVLYKYSQELGSVVSMRLNIVSVVFAAVLLASGIIWAFSEKKRT